MVRGHHGRLAAIELPRAAKLADSDCGAQEGGHSGVAQRDDHVRFHELELLVHERKTALHFLWLRLPISGRSALQDVAHVNVEHGVESHRGDHPVEQLPRATDEWNSLRVLVPTGRLAEKENFGLRIPTRKNGVRARLVKRATRA